MRRLGDEMELAETGERQIVVRGEFLVCALIVVFAFVFIHWVAGATP